MQALHLHLRSHPHAGGFTGNPGSQVISLAARLHQAVALPRLSALYKVRIAPQSGAGSAWAALGLYQPCAASRERLRRPSRMAM